MKTVLEVLRLCTEYLQQHEVEHPRREAEWLLSDALGLSRLQLYLDHERPLIDSELARCRSWLRRRAAGEPLAYIRGEMEFYGCWLTVDKRALIPRQETELLVDYAAKEIIAQAVEGAVLWDLCCGTGCAAIALKHKLPSLTVIGSDLSADALALASHNATRNEVVVTWLQGDLLEPLKSYAPIDYCFCNPPYISQAEMLTLSREVRDYEPHSALDGGSDGLAFYRRLAAELPPYLRSGGLVWLEIGADQGASVSALFNASPWHSCRLQQDLSGKDRFIFLVRE